MSTHVFVGVDDRWSDQVHPRQTGPTLGLLCPVCGGTRNHLGWPKNLVGTSEARMISVSPHWSGEGNGWSIPIHGACGHQWNLCLGYHAGQVTVFATLSEALDSVRP